MSEITKLVEIIKIKIKANTDLMWTHYNSIEELIEEIDLNSKLLENKDKEGLEFFNVLFSPTGTFSGTFYTKWMESGIFKTGCGI